MGTLIFKDKNNNKGTVEGVNATDYATLNDLIEAVNIIGQSSSARNFIDNILKIDLSNLSDNGKSVIDDLIYPAGSIKLHLSNTIPEKWLLLNGAVVSRENIPRLVEYAYDNDLVRDATEQSQYEANPATFSGKIFGPGDGSTTIQIPDMRGRSLMGATSASTVGRYQPEQLPNVTGNVGFSNNITAVNNYFLHSEPGALSSSNYDSYYNVNNATLIQASNARKLHLDASNSNSIYTNNGKVYPLSLALNFIIKT